ncbi:MAG: sigma-54-dependent Fis family transcriptional regulator [Deltaproteobacteria bacterium]|nr:sigma-54-dependent Fis family transcriptional regulator [Deltaproteobacteria bacterium]
MDSALQKHTVLVVDDELGVRQSFYMVLKDEYNVLIAEDGKKAIEIFLSNSIDLILLDIMLPDINGIDLLYKFKETDPNTEVIMITAIKDVQTAVKAIKDGAYDYVVKPFKVEDIKNIVTRALEKHLLMKEVTYLRDELERSSPFKGIIGKDPSMLKIYDLISTISNSEGPVLIQGESGTGKELIARAIHNISNRNDKPFVVINCAAIPATLMESEIFGHNKGAFTGASQNKMGKLEIADKGTVFLDDVDTLDISMQAKLLRVIQEKELGRLGSTKIMKIDVRFLAASNRDLKELVAQNMFREDLFYRLNVFPIEIPPLRKRKNDIPLLINHFLDLNKKNRGMQKKQFSKQAIKILMDNYDWPGNVRELQNMIERMVTITKGNVIYPKDISSFQTREKEIKDLPLKEAVSIYERQYILEVLANVDGNKKLAADLLGVHRNTLLNKLHKTGEK